VVHLSRRGWRLAAVSTALLTGLTVLPSGPAAAAPAPAPAAVASKVIAKGLNNPRHLRWSDGGLYVAEAGTGGKGACLPSPEGGKACLGASGSITRVKDGRQRRVVTKLPSLAAANGGSALGPSDVLVKGQRFTVALGLGADPSKRVDLGRGGRRLGTVSTGRLGRSTLTVQTDVAAHEALQNPDAKLDKGQPVLDTNPVALLERGRRRYVVDAGGNALIRHHRGGDVETSRVFPAVQVPAPAFLGLPPGTKIPMDAVPTAAVFGPDGAIYVSQLTGFPFPVGGASIWRVAPGKKPTKYATNLTNVTDLAFGKGGVLYAVQLADKGLLAEKPTGSLVRIPKGGGAKHATVIAGLPGPYGLALHGKSAYLTTHATEAGKGSVVRVSLGSSS
jgi:hypothetical protein